MKKDYICVFDCETIPDVAALVRVLDEDAIADCFEPFDKKNFAKLIDAQVAQKIGDEKQNASLNFAVNSAEQNSKIENSEQNSAPQSFTQQDVAPQSFASENFAENLAHGNFASKNSASLNLTYDDTAPQRSEALRLRISRRKVLCLKALRPKAQRAKISLQIPRKIPR